MSECLEGGGSRRAQRAAVPAPSTSAPPVRRSVQLLSQDKWTDALCTTEAADEAPSVLPEGTSPNWWDRSQTLCILEGTDLAQDLQSWRRNMAHGTLLLESEQILYDHELHSAACLKYIYKFSDHKWMPTFRIERNQQLHSLFENVKFFLLKAEIQRFQNKRGARKVF